MLWIICVVFSCCGRWGCNSYTAAADSPPVGHCVGGDDHRLIQDAGPWLKSRTVPAIGQRIAT